LFATLKMESLRVVVTIVFYSISFAYVVARSSNALIVTATVFLSSCLLDIKSCHVAWKWSQHSTSVQDENSSGALVTT